MELIAYYEELGVTVTGEDGGIKAIALKALDLCDDLKQLHENYVKDEW